MKIFNTLSRKKEIFKPIKKGKIGMYVCGPTVYDVGHLGHARAAMSFDVIRRYFQYKGFDVTFVSNITDVDDKLIKRAAKEGVSEKELAEKIIPLYKRDYDALRVTLPDFQPRATQYIPKMAALIEKLVQKGAAYATSDGIYFEVSKALDYGKLSHQKLKDLQAGARIDVDEKKKNPEDFALWKAAKPGEPKWPGPLGMSGRPGWHIECSAMSMDILGETFDIHGGGIDLQFPHHEDEIAQSEAATGKPFAKYWMHNGHIRVNKEKMSKSLGNFFTIEDILKKENPLVVRYFLLSTHYRMPIDFSDDLLLQAKNSLERLHDCVRNLNGEYFVSEKSVIDAQRENKKFEEFMDDDFDIAGALSVVFSLVKKVNALRAAGKLTKKDAQEAEKFLRDIDKILGVIFVEDKEIDDEIDGLIKERDQARKNKDFKKADEIRAVLEKKGIILEDTNKGTIWKRSL